MEYYELPKNKRWMDRWEKTLTTVDIVNIPYALTERLKAIYPINEVPSELVRGLDSLETTLSLADSELDEFLELVNKFVSESGYDNGDG